jgi:hypothetical protein
MPSSRLLRLRTIDERAMRARNARSASRRRKSSSKHAIAGTIVSQFKNGQIAAHDEHHLEHHEEQPAAVRVQRGPKMKIGAISSTTWLNRTATVCADARASVKEP